jgi:Ca-activated chloride channel family protein
VSFGWPVALLGLLVVPLLAGLVVWYDRRRRRAAARFASPSLLPNVVERSPGLVRFVPTAILLVALVAMIVGVARPHAMVSVPREEATIVLALDVSRSMKATDVEPTRLDAARAAAKLFLAEVPEQFRVGVVSFATRAVVALPPTDDRELVAASLDTLKTGEGTAIGDAVALSIQIGRRLREADGAIPPTSVLLISDGARDGGILDPRVAAERARQQGVPVYTILVGTPDGVVEETLPGGFTQRIRVPPSGETLAQISEISGGESFTAFDVEQLRQVYEELGSRIGSRREEREITDLFAAGSALLLVAGGALSALLFRRVP